jgi:hypothetical protein
MELIGRAIAFLESHPAVALAIVIALLLLFLYKHPKIFFVIAALAVVVYLVLSLTSAGVSKKERMIKKSVGPTEAAPVRLPRVTFTDKM